MAPTLKASASILIAWRRKLPCLQRSQNYLSSLQLLVFDMSSSKTRINILKSETDSPWLLPLNETTQELFPVNFVDLHGFDSRMLFLSICWWLLLFFTLSLETQGILRTASWVTLLKCYWLVIDNVTGTMPSSQRKDWKVKRVTSFSMYVEREN